MTNQNRLNLKEALANHRRDANKVALKYGFLCLWAFAGLFSIIWMWTDIKLFEMQINGSHLFVSLLISLFLIFVIVSFLGFPEPDSSHVSDDVLMCLSELTVFDKAAFIEILYLLKNQAYLTLVQVEIFLQNELMAESTQKALNQPGAKALMSTATGD